MNQNRQSNRVRTIPLVNGHERCYPIWDSEDFMHITLSPDVQKLIEERVRSGKYQSAGDVIAAAVATLDQQEHAGDFQPGELDTLLAIADEEIARGDLLDGEKVFRELRELDDAYATEADRGRPKAVGNQLTRLRQTATTIRANRYPAG